MPFLQPNQQRQSTEGKNSIINKYILNYTQAVHQSVAERFFSKTDEF